jgi:hypothetical protein
MQLQRSEGNPGGISTEMRIDSMTFGRFQRLGLECSVMHQFFGHENAVCEVPSPIQPFTATVCDVSETVWQKCTALLCDEEWGAIGLTKSSFLFVFCLVSGEDLITTGTKDCSIFGGSRVNRNPHGRTLSDFLANTVNESTFSIIEWFIIQTNEFEICDSKGNRCSESQKFFQIGIT